MFDFFAKTCKLNGNRHLTPSKDESPFCVIEFQIGFKNLIYRYVENGWSRFHEAGLERLWRKYITMHKVFRGSTSLSKDKYFEAVQMSFANVRDQIHFHEAAPVSMKLIQPIFVISGVLIGTSVLAFLTEYREKVFVWAKLVHIIILKITHYCL